MPELPEVETVCQGLVSFLVNRTLTLVDPRRATLRGPLPASMASWAGFSVESLGRRGKTMLWHMRVPEDHELRATFPLGRPVVLVHLGMSGHFRINPEDTTPHDHVMIETCAGDRLVYRDPRRFGSILMADSAAHGEDMLRRLGPEPLMSSWQAEDLKSALQGRTAPIKNALMDQAIIAGLGNIYVCESLFRARIHPCAPAGGLTMDQVRRLHACVREVLTEAVAAGGSSLRDHHHPSGHLGCFQHKFDVYGRHGLLCRVCQSTPILQERQAGRSTFYCPQCQPEID